MGMGISYRVLDLSRGVWGSFDCWFFKLLEVKVVGLEALMGSEGIICGRIEYVLLKSML